MREFEGFIFPNGRIVAIPEEEYMAAIEAGKRNGIVLTPQQAEQWWQKNEKWFKDTLTEYGNEILFNANFSEV